MKKKYLLDLVPNNPMFFLIHYVKESWKMPVFSESHFGTVVKFILLTPSQTTDFRLFQTERVCRRQFLI